ncbi:unnamed protein product, partial [Pocillopora meandrina]
STVKNCAELHRSGQRINGIYTIKPDNSQAFDVYCDQTTDGGGWTVFQRRLTGSVDFNRSWADYKHGFKSFLDGEFWLGLDKILRLTKKNKNNRLRVDLGVDSKTIVYAEYKWFGIANKTAEYQLNIGNLASNQLLLTGTKMEDIGTYHCVAHNSAGERVSTVSSLLIEDLGKRHSSFAPENDNLFLKTVPMIYPKSFISLSRQKEGLLKNVGSLCMSSIDFTKTTKGRKQTGELKNCAELHKSCQRINGIYTIKPDNSQAFDVYCDQTTDGGGWTVFQRRLTGSVDFNRSWADYKHGFGSFLDGEFWLGLDKILRLTKKNKNNRLRVDLGVDSKTIVYAEYKWFGIANETAEYQLNIGNLASATVKDSLRDHNGSKFRTWDQKHSSWWFPEDCIIRSNLNGIYESKENGKIHWGKLDLDDPTRTPKTTEMKIRPADF